MSPAEVVLWSKLRRRPHGLKFRRQHPAGPYVADFFCAEARLAVEVDGIGHDMADRPERDAIRDAFFASHGVRVLRVLAREVLGSADSAVDLIVGEAIKRCPLHRAVPGPPPRSGEEIRS